MNNLDKLPFLSLRILKQEYEDELRKERNKRYEIKRNFNHVYVSDKLENMKVLSSDKI